MEANVLSMLTRLRQIALDPRLVPENYLEVCRRSHSRRNRSTNAFPRNFEPLLNRRTPVPNSKLLKSHLRRNDVYKTCWHRRSRITKNVNDSLNAFITLLIQAFAGPICFDVMTNPRITTCAHRFCLLCILEVRNILVLGEN